MDIVKLEPITIKGVKNTKQEKVRKERVRKERGLGERERNRQLRAVMNSSTLALLYFSKILLDVL